MRKCKLTAQAKKIKTNSVERCRQPTPPPLFTESLASTHAHMLGHSQEVLCFPALMLFPVRSLHAARRTCPLLMLFLCQSPGSLSCMCQLMLVHNTGIGCPLFLSLRVCAAPFPCPLYAAPLQITPRLEPEILLRAKQDFMKIDSAADLE